MHFREQSFAAAMEICSESELAEVVHAWIPGGAGFVAHAWAEVEDAVYDLTESEQPIPKAEYYSRMGVREDLSRRYGRVEYFTLMAETGSFGPFDTKFFFANQTAFLPPGVTTIPFAGEVAALTAAFIWALATIIYARTGNQAPALFLNLIKGSIAVAMLSVTVFVLGDTPPILSTSQWLWLAGSGIVGISIGDSAYFSAIKRVGPSQTLLIESLAPPLTGVLALCFLHEAIGFWAWAGIFLTMSGILWVVTEHQPQQKCLNLPGLGFATLAALCQATGMVMSRQVMVSTEITPLWAALIRLAAASLVLWTLLPILKPEVVLRRECWRSIGTARNGWAFFTLAVFLGTFLGIWLQQAALKLTGAAIAQTLISVSPLFALGLAVMTGHKVSRRSLVGALVTLAGVALFFR